MTTPLSGSARVLLVEDDQLTREVLMRAVLRRVGRGGGREVLGCADLVVDTSAHETARAGAPIDLTPREFALLVAMLRHQNVVLSKVQLLNEVWGFEHYDLNVVEVHMSALRRKLEEHGPRLIRTVRSVGYVLRPPVAA